jgi:hypothetical protein
MENGKMKVGIGAESKPLDAKKVKVLKADIEMQKDKSNTDVGEKVSLTVQHPDRKEALVISKAKYETQGKVKVSGLWFKVDNSGMIPYNSALANLLRFCKVADIESLIGKEIETTKDEDNFLVAKAY